MGTTVDKLNKLKVTKEAIRVAINNKGGTLTENDTFASYETAINGIQVSGDINPLQYIIDNNKKGDGKPSCNYLFYYYSGKSLDDVITKIDTSSCGSMNSMFYYCSSLTTIPQFNTSSCTSMTEMFSECWSLTAIPQLDTSKVMNMYTMFLNCRSLTTIPQLNTSSCTRMTSMFSGCNKLITIPQLDTSKVDDMYNMFYNCSSLIAIPQLNTSSCTSMTSMFSGCNKLSTIDLTYMNMLFASKSSRFAYNCYSLTKLIIRNINRIPILDSNSFDNCYHFYGTQNDDYNPNGLKDGRIYVPDDKVDELKAATNWSVFADIIVPLSTLVEE